MLKFLYISLILILSTVVHNSTLAQLINDSDPWSLYKAPPIPDSKNINNHNETAFYLVELKEQTKRTEIMSNSFKIIRSLDNSHLIIQESPTKMIQSNNKFIQRYWKTNDLWKLNHTLLNIYNNNFKTYTIQTLVPRETIKHLSGNNHFKLKSIQNDVITISGRHSDILKYVLPMINVTYIGIESVEPHTESRVIDLNLNPNTINRIHHEYPLINGKTITVSIQEPPYDINDIDLLGRHTVSGVEFGEVDDHATEMATISAGAGNSFVTGKGVANSVILTSSGFSDVLPDSDDSYAALDITVQNHSYGTKIENFYGGRASLFDQSANNNKNLLHVMSSGNQGLEQDIDGPYSGVNGLANLTGNFKMAKNIMIVGTVDTVGRAISFASRGPTYDGRIRPEVVAYSTVGSSNSAALVTGLVALLQQEYKETFTEPLPSALAKALVINSAQDIGNRGPDYFSGFGNVDGYRAISDLKNGYIISDNILHQETKEFMLLVPSDAQNLKVTIVWNDPAALANAGQSLVNDIDSSIKDPNAINWLPWTLSTIPDSLSLVQPAVRGIDRINNIEQITIEDPSEGNYTIQVTGHDIPNGPQTFHVAYSWDTSNEFEWSYPTGSDNMPYNGETIGYFRWKSTLANASGQLEYSIDNGENWILIEDNIDLASGHYRWDAPLVNTHAIARMQTPTGMYPTDVFTISRPPKVSVGFNCSDSVLIQWENHDQAISYEVKTLGTSVLETVANPSDTTFTIQKDAFATSLFAVQPIYQNDILPIRSLTFDYNSLGNSCFLVSFFPVSTSEEGVTLRTILGTTYGVDQVIFERKVNDTFERVGSISQLDSVTVDFLDISADQGINTHRARIVLNNGVELVSDPVDTYFLTTLPFLLFPNPVSNQENLFVFSKDFENVERTLTLYDRTGKALKSGKLISERDFISIAGLTPGLYFYSVDVLGKKYRGKVIIN